MREKKYPLLAAIVILIILNSCAPSRIVRPLDKGQKAINASLGGALIGFAGTTIPIPLTTVTYAQGVADKTTAFGSVHTTSLLFGIFQTDIGVCHRLYYNDSLRFGISVNPVINLAFDKWEKKFKCWPQADINFYWEIKPKKSFFYAGVENWFELAQKKAHDQNQQTHWIFCPQIGYTYTRNKWNYNTEIKYIAPNISHTPNVVDYKGIGGKGAIGVYISFTRKF